MGEGLFVTSVCLFISMFPDCLASPLSQKSKEGFGTLPTVPPLPSIMTSTDGVPDLTIPTITLGHFHKMEITEKAPRTTNTPHTTNTPRISPKATFSSLPTVPPLPSIMTSTDGVQDLTIPTIALGYFNKKEIMEKAPRTTNTPHTTNTPRIPPKATFSSLPTVPPLPSIMTSTDGVP